MKQIIRRWAGVGLMTVSVLTVGSLLTLQAGMPLAPFVPLQQVLMADGGGDRPAPAPCPKGKCWSGDATA